MIVVAVTNRKGGVGKSTLATHLGGGLAARGYRVLVVDADAQGHCSVLFDKPKADGLYDVLVRRVPATSVLIEVESYRFTLDRQPKGRLSILPSNSSTAFLAYEIDDPLMLHQALNELGFGDVYDVILIDTPPSRNVFDAAIYAAADAMIFVTEAATLSLDGVVEGIHDFDEFNAQRRAQGREELRLIGIIPNKVTVSTGIQRRNLNNLAGLAEYLWQPIRARAAWQEAAARGLTVFVYKGDSPAAADAWGAVDALERALATW